MSYAKHIIQRQIMELEIPEGLDRTDVQNRVSRICRQEIVQLLDTVLSRKGGPASQVIDRIEINIGRIPEGRLEQALAEKVARALEEKLQEIKRPPAPQPGSTASAALPKQDYHSDAELLLYFMHTGLFPWWAQQTAYGRLEEAFQAALAQNDPVFRNLFAALLHDREIVRRLVYTFGDALLGRIAAQYTNGHGLAAAHAARHQFWQIFANRLSREQLRQHWWYSIYQAVTGVTVRSENELLEKAGSLFVRLAAQQSNWTALQQFVQVDRAGTGIMERMAAFTEGSVAGIEDAQPHLEVKEPIPGKELSAEPGRKPADDPDRVAADYPAFADGPVIENRLLPQVDVDKIYIRNAGLVLLWPFLHRFFQNLELADEKTLLDESRAERACLMLQFLVTGSAEELFEAQLPLNKLLCGVPLLQPVNTQWIISEAERETAELFVQAVIQNGGKDWKNLSVAGLQQAYLNREGILSGRDGNWLLQVKRKTYDIIVDRLPWTIQVIKRPWMERLIFVEW